MCDDSRDSIAATVVFTEYLTEKAPNGCDRVEHSVPVLDTMLVENVSDTGLSQNVREWKSFVVRKAARTAFRLVMEPSST